MAEQTEDLVEATSSDSKAQLILAGERLFARLGVEGTSLREIAAAAGHGNNNAVRYHFGSKQGLIQAIFRHRVSQLEPIRGTLMERVDERKLTGDARSLLEVIMLPHLQLRDSEGKFSYAAFLLQYMLHHRPKGIMHAADDPAVISSSLGRATALIRERLFYLGFNMADLRIGVATTTFLSMLINIENRALAPTAIQFREIVDDTLEQMVAALTAPANRLPNFLDDDFLI